MFVAAQTPSTPVLADGVTEQQVGSGAGGVRDAARRVLLAMQQFHQTNPQMATRAEARLTRSQSPTTGYANPANPGIRNGDRPGVTPRGPLSGSRVVAASAVHSGRGSSSRGGSSTTVPQRTSQVNLPDQHDHLHRTVLSFTC